MCGVRWCVSVCQRTGAGAARLAVADCLFQFGNTGVSRCLLRGCANGGGKEGGKFGAGGAGGGKVGGGAGDDFGKCKHNGGGFRGLDGHKVVNNGGIEVVTHRGGGALYIGINGTFAGGGRGGVYAPKVFHQSGVGGELVGIHSSKILFIGGGCVVFPLV